MLRTTILISLVALLCACSSTSDKSETGSSESQDDVVRGSPKKINDPTSDPIRLSNNDKKKGKATLYKVQSSKPLELPPELITSSNETVLTGIQNSADDDLRILPQAIRARIVNDGDKRWLEIDSSVEKAWKSVLAYWSLGDVDLVEYNPQAGLMETQWIEQTAEIDDGSSFFGRMTQNLVTSLTKTNTSLDKFRVRFERVSENQSLMYVSHRSIARKEIAYGKKISEFEWVELASDPEREAALLQNLVLIFDESAAS